MQGLVGYRWKLFFMNYKCNEQRFCNYCITSDVTGVKQLTSAMYNAHG